MLELAIRQLITFVFTCVKEAALPTPDLVSHVTTAKMIIILFSVCGNTLPVYVAANI